MTPQTFLHRQVHPSWIQQGKITSQTFKPTPKDQRRLSVYNGDMITPSKAWDHYTGQLKLQSRGVVSVTVEECNKLELNTFEDPEPFPEHAFVDFQVHSNSAIERKAKLLTRYAEQRGWSYLPLSL
ncbi:hypothetical protein [Thermicanus aegyptius]|uniref:hypothetical protein n=1 Tax=Thermicanus aegyptius TaxID=94009 RepID=UPI00048E7A33|nr:hypothetical protein [Thermicanus aegyptius]